MRILAIDPGLGTLGYAVIDHWLECEITGEPVTDLNTCGVIRTKPQEYGRRLVELHADLEELFLEHAPDEVAIEKLFSHFKNASTMEGVSAARGCVFMIAARLGIPVSEYTPTQIKKHVSANGRADKKEMQQAVSRLLHVPIIQPDDAADAVAIGLTHLAQLTPLGSNV